MFLIMPVKLVRAPEIQHRALKLRIYPTQEQEILINKTFGCCRQIFNNRLFERNEFYENVIKPEQDKAKQKACRCGSRQTQVQVKKVP